MNYPGKFLITVAATMLAACALSQTFFQGDPNIIQPKSDFAGQGHFHTNYLINVSQTRKAQLYTFLHEHQAPRMFYVRNGKIQPMGFGPGPQSGVPGYAPADIRAAYNIPGNLGSNAIAIVDAFDDPTALSDFNAFSQQFGLPSEPSTNPTSPSNNVFQVVYQNGVEPTADPGWAGEISLDIEWAHAMAPRAKIYLVEAQDNSNNLYSAVQIAQGLPNVREVSMSWGGGEFPGENSSDSLFTGNNIVYFASSGDGGSGTIYPAVSPNVVGVGGTSLVLGSNDSFISETAWIGSGGGPSFYEPIPTYQSVVSGTVGASRGCPDISGPADPYEGCAVFGIYAFGGWAVIGGTSWASPTEAGIANARGKFSTSTNAELTRLYQEYSVAGTYVSLYRDITVGNTGIFNAGPGYDFTTGVGSATNLYQTTPPNQNFGPLTVTPEFGTVVSGNVSSLQTIDNNSYVMKWAPFFKIGSASGYQTTYQLPLPLSQYKELYITFNAQSSTLETYQLYAWNYTTGKFDNLIQLHGSNAFTTYTYQFPQASWQNYVDPNGNAKVEIISELSRRLIQPVNQNTSTDMINLQVGF